jgi:3-oxoacyl-[acyl-carrier-protein] synthase III
MYSHKILKGENMKKAAILGTGFYVPDKILTNQDFEKIVDTSDEWITTRTGIKERRIAAPGQATSDLGVRAAEMALKKSGIKKDEIDMVITGTVTGDYQYPATANIIAHKLGIKNAPSFDISAGCSGFVYGLSLCRSLIASGNYKKILLINAEKFSAFTDYKDRNTCVLMGDGAGAVVIGESEENGILSDYTGSDGSKTDLLFQPGGGSVNPATTETVEKRMHFLKMNGREVYKCAIDKLQAALETAVKKAGLSVENIDFFIFHQANLRIIEAIAKKLKIPESKNIINIHKYGNTSAATIPIALAEAVAEGRIKKGNIVAFSAFGAGLTWGSAVVKM